MEIRFWGVRGSTAAPMTRWVLERKIADAVREYERMRAESGDLKTFLGALGERTALYGGNTACVEVCEGGERLILDAGTGLRELGLALASQREADGACEYCILVSHCHWDHIQGFPFFVPVFIPGCRINIVSSSDRIVDAFSTQQKHPYFPVPFDDVPAEVNLRNFAPGETIELSGFQVQSIGLTHPGRCFGYRIDGPTGSLAYLTDVELLAMGDRRKQEVRRFVDGCGVVVVDSQYRFEESIAKKTWGHSSVVSFVDLFEGVGIGRILTFHYDPNNSDDEIDDCIAEGVAHQKQKAGGVDFEIVGSREGMVLTVDAVAPLL